MSYLLRMSGEIHDWLAGLRRTEPSAAMLTGQALAALMSEGASLGPPLVVPIAPAWPEDLLAELDSSYQHRLERLQVLRKRAAEAAWLARDAVMLSADMLVEARAGQAPEASAHGYDDISSFAGEFFGGEAAEIEAGAATLAAKNRAHTLAEQRTRLGLTQTEVARRMGIPREQVAAIERADPDTTDVQTLAAYIIALGGRLEITADFAGDRILLR